VAGGDAVCVEGQGMSKPNEYRIEHVRDLLAIPEDRIDACLAGMRKWLPVARDFTKAAYNVAGLLQMDLQEHPCGGFVWIDDGENECRGIEFTVKRVKE